MKNKNYPRVITILVMLLLTLSSVFVTASTDIKKNDYILNFSDVAELPEWELGNFWVYDMHFDFVLSGVFGVDGMDPNDPNKGITNMRVEVVEVDENNDEYTLEINGDLLAQLEVLGIGFGTYTADLEGEAHIEISTLAIKDFTFSTSGEYQLIITRQTDVDVTMTFTPPFNFLDFPIDPDEEPWNADTYGSLSGHITVEGLYDTDFNTEGPFEDEIISFVKQDEVTVPGGTFDSYLISGSMGPSHGGWSNLWYSPAAKYLVKVDEKINDWEGVDAELELTLQATNCVGTSSVIDVTMHKIKQLDEIDPLPGDQADWTYQIQIYTGESWEKNSHECPENHDEITVDKTHQFNIVTKTPEIRIKLWERDVWPGADDLADISSVPGAEINDETPDDERCLFYCKYDIVDDEIIEIDYYEVEGDYYITRGDFPPDSSTSTDENDAKVWFKITDDYEPPAKPKKPQGPSSGKPGTEYTYTTSAANPNENQRFYLWDWGDGTYSNWQGPYNAGETVEAKHAWAQKGSFGVRVKAKDVFDVESAWSDSLSVSMPRSKISTESFFTRIFEKIPHEFPILRYLLHFM